MAHLRSLACCDRRCFADGLSVFTNASVRQQLLGLSLALLAVAVATGFGTAAPAVTLPPSVARQDEQQRAQHQHRNPLIVPRKGKQLKHRRIMDLHACTHTKFGMAGHQTGPERNPKPPCGS